MPTMQRYRMLLEYDGTAFCGWQSQPNGCAVQDVLERALEQLCAGQTRVIGAGRTDAGVHASGQVAHFETQTHRPEATFLRALNALTPPALTILALAPVPKSFHARFSALYREYCYCIMDRPTPPALERHRVWHQRRRLDVVAMRQSGQALLGTHDFSAFRAASCQANNPVRTLSRFEVLRAKDEVRIVLGANAFLQHMVRNIVGSLVRVGHHEEPQEWLARLLAGKNRILAAPTAPPHGLNLTQVLYPGDTVHGTPQPLAPPTKPAPGYELCFEEL